MGKFYPSRRAYTTPTNISTDITNMPLAGGNKLQGLPPSIDVPSNLNYTTITRARNSPKKRTEITCINQLGGIGKLRSQFVPTADGINGCPDLFDEYNFTLFDNFTNQTMNNILINSLLNAEIVVNGLGTGSNGGFKSASNDSFSTNYYVLFNGSNIVETQFNPIMESIDVNYFNFSTYDPRSINSNSIRSMVDNNNNIYNQKLYDITINSITISYIAGNQSNGGDKPDMFTNLGLGKLTWPESLYLELVGPYGRVDLIDIFSTKDPIIPTPPRFDKVYNWFMTGKFKAINPCAGTSVPINGGRHASADAARAIKVPVGTPYVTGQTFAPGLSNFISANSTPALTNAVFSFPPSSQPPCTGSTGANFKDIFLNALTNSGSSSTVISNSQQLDAKTELANRISELGDQGTGNYNKPLITYSGPNDPQKFTEITIPINKTFKVDELLPDINEITQFRIFQERHTGAGDNYGIRYLDINISYRTWKPDVWNNAYRTAS